MAGTKTTGKLFITLSALLLVCIMAVTAHAAVPTTINYQGYLTDSGGMPVNEPKSIIFSFYTVASGGSAIWTETQPTVAVANGVYSVTLGSVTPVTATVFNSTDVYLGVTIGIDPEMTPRQTLTSVGFAFKAADADSLNGETAESFATVLHLHTGGDITSGTVMETRIDTAMARDSEVASSITTHTSNSSAHHTKYTNAEAVAAIKAADGAGSTLDADLLDGQHAVAFVDLASAQTISGEKTFSSNVTMSGNLDLPATTATTGIIKSGGNTLIHTYGTDNFFAGINAGNLTMTGNANTVSGTSALAGNTTGYNNTASGRSALEANTTGNNNTGSGRRALAANTTGGNNTASGAAALVANTSGSYNTASGTSALASNTTGVENTAGGFAALSSNSTGLQNTALGYSAGSNQTTGSNNIYVGHNVVGVAAESNVTRIGNGQTQAYIAGTVNASGFVGDGSGLTNINAATVGGQASSSFATSIHAHAGGDITSGTVLDARIDAAIARDSEVSSSITTHTANASAHHARYTDAEAVTAIKAADGAGSTLDADLLDGQHAAAFSSATHNHTATYVQKAGDTMTGALSLPADGLTVGGTQLVLSGGKVGVGATPSLGAKFQVANPDEAQQAGYFKNSNAFNNLPALYAHTTGSGQALFGLNQGTGRAGHFQISNAANSASALVAQTNGTGYAGEFLGNVTVSGNLDLPATTATTGIIKSGANRLIHTYGTSNFFAGIDAGNLTMTGVQNTGTGRNVLQSNTTGAINTASGIDALYSNISGVRNTASGAYALRYNTTGDDNTASGAWALYSNTTGYENTASGYRALYSNTTASKNTAIGTRSLYTQSFQNLGTVWDSHNTAVGFEALYFNQPTVTGNGINNTALGSQALRSNTTGNYNTASGRSALAANTAGSSNTASGYSALAANTTGIHNTASGMNALAANTTGSLNTASGSSALAANITGHQNTASGMNALASNTTGIDNTASGMNALAYNTTGDNNTASGRSALVFNTTGSSNTASGMNALEANTTGFSNTASGYSALSSNTTGYRNTAVGLGADVASGNLTNATVIGYLAIVSGSNKVRIGNAFVQTIEGQVGWSALSDIRIKKDVEDIGFGLEFIKTLRPVQYRLKQGNDRIDFGFIAQEVEARLGVDYNVLGIAEDEDRSLSLRYTDFIAPMVKAMQEQQAEIESQQTEIDALKSELAEIKALLLSGKN